jgi:Na+/H+-dicarboxylate symporter
MIGRIFNKIRKSIYIQIIVCLVLGVIVGFVNPQLGVKCEIFAYIFICLIKIVIAPIVFGTIVLAFAKSQNLKQFGKMGLISIIYFEVLTTIALVIGLVVTNVFKPGVGMNITESSFGDIGEFDANAQHIDFLGSIIPKTFVSAFVDGQLLQVILVALFVGVAMQSLGKKNEPLVKGLSLIVDIFFKIIGYMVKLVPLSAFGAIAYAVGSSGADSLKNLLWLMLCIAGTSVAFTAIVLGAVMKYCNVNLWKFIVFIKDELYIAMATRSSESVLPQLIKKLEKAGVHESVSSLVVPLGYSFNLDGSCIYLTCATVFLAQAINVPLSIGEQIVMCLILMITSKGAAGVSGAAIVTLAATFESFPKMPVQSISLLLGVDRKSVV